MGKAVRGFVAVALWVGVCLGVLGTRALSADAALSKEEVIERAWRALFGDRQRSEIKTLSVDGYFHGATIPNRMTVRRPNQFRNETRSGILVFDGQRAAWVTRVPDETGRPRGPERIEAESWRHFEVDIALLFPAFFEYPCEFKGIDTSGGSAAYVLDVPLPKGGKVIYFVDAKSFLVTRRLVSWDGGGGDLWENKIEKYQDHGGILFPAGYVFPGRNGLEKGTYQNVRFNVPVKDELFELPPELK